MPEYATLTRAQPGPGRTGSGTSRYSTTASRVSTRAFMCSLAYPGGGTRIKCRKRGGGAAPQRMLYGEALQLEADVCHAGHGAAQELVLRAHADLDHEN